MKIGDRIYVRGYVDEIRKDTVIVRNDGGYFGTIPSEVITGELPSAQPEIVRCRDCKYASQNGVYGCRLERFSVHDESIRLFADDYCSVAERRTDE